MVEIGRLRGLVAHRKFLAEYGFDMPGAGGRGTVSALRLDSI